MEYKMDKILKTSVISAFVVLIMLLSLFCISTIPPDTSPRSINGEDRENGQLGSGEQANQTNNGVTAEQKLSPVLCEIGTATWCKYCPELSEKVCSIYDSGKYPLYVVSLVYDKSSAAKERLEEDYNIYGFPTLFMDGGRKVVYGSKVTKDEIERYINEVAKKPKKNISMDISFDIENNKTINCRVYVKNNEPSTYSGELKVYLVEINSRWYDYNGKPYRYALIDFIVSKNVRIEAGEKDMILSSWTANKEFVPLNKENLMLLAILFSEDVTRKYSDPPDNKYPFDARYVDSISGKRLSEGNLPPQIGIAVPKEGMVHFRSKPLFKNWFGGTAILIGKTYANFTVMDEGSFIKIRIYLDDTLRRVIIDRNFHGESEYRFRISGPLIGKHTLRIEAIDEYGKSSETTLSFFSFILFG